MGKKSEMLFPQIIIASNEFKNFMQNFNPNTFDDKKIHFVLVYLFEPCELSDKYNLSFTFNKINFYMMVNDIQVFLTMELFEVL